MNKKIICVIAILIAIILGIYLGVINNSKKTENMKSAESFVNLNVVENKTIPTNKISELVNNVVESDNIALKENIRSSLLEDDTPDLSGQVSVVPYAMTEDEINEVNNGNSHTFRGTVISINDEAVFIKPDEGYEDISGNQITIDKSNFGNGLELNDRVEITFIGEVTKTYLGNIHVVAIKIL